MNRLLKYINTAIAVLAVLVLGAVYWYGWRPLPQTSGSVAAPVAQPVTVRFGSLGEPHISAANEDDLLFTQGYLTAQERLFQMDALRRQAAGDLAEIVGMAALESDREMRRLRLRRIAEDAYVSLPPKDRAALAAYARGVSYYISTHLDRLPFEFKILGYDPRPWSVVDCILAGLQMYKTLTTTWPDELMKRNMLASGDPAKGNFLMPARTGPEMPPGLLAPLGGDAHAGSNAWAISGAHTASGKPLLSNDMHLEFSVPGIWFLVHLQAPGINASGVSLPGAPGVIVGHNERIAWGVTNLHFDVQDLYAEKIDERSGKFQFRGKILQARSERELIAVKGARAVEVGNWVTVHGPLWASDRQQRLSIRWAAAEPRSFQFPFLEINRARNWGEFTAALARFPGPAQNFVYADVDGNIGYHAGGLLPIRRHYAGDVPVDGTSGDFEWDGFIPFDRLPSSFNPPDGIIVTANQNPFPADYPYAVNGNFASYYRSTQIRNLLMAKNGLRPSDTLAVQRDVYSAFSHYLARSLVEAYDRRKSADPNLADAIAVLREWNGQMDKNQAAPLIATLAFQHVRKAAAESASPGAGENYDIQMAPAVLESLLRTRPPGWFKDYDETLLKSLADALEEGRRIQGQHVRKWLYGATLELKINHPIGHRLPLVAKYFDIGPLWMSGSSTTEKQTTRRLGPSMRLNADLAEWDHSLLNLPIGESGHVLSRHYKDQWAAYYNGTSFPMPFQKVDASSVLQLVPER
jgi:penicillin amidase